MRITTEYVIDQLRVRHACGDTVTKEACSVTQGWPFGRSTVSRLFGSWNKALIAAQLPIRRHGAPRPEHPCLACGAPTANQKYCSKRCAARVNNLIPHRRKQREHPCKQCGVSITGRNRLCGACLIATAVDNKTIAQVMLAVGKAAAKFGPIRARARQRYYTPASTCERCGYTKHVEVCHVKAIADFDIDTPVAEVNARDNIMLLCPNCHWEQHNDPTFNPPPARG